MPSEINVTVVHRRLLPVRSREEQHSLHESTVVSLQEVARIRLDSRILLQSLLSEQSAL